MSEREEFLARWSRRKRQQIGKVGIEKVAADQVEDASGVAAPRPPAGMADGDKSPDKEAAPLEASEPLFDATTLPSIESITAETDVRAFLAPGVPAELTRAALRRAWAADPKIRDFVGLADYAWDFHAADAMAGFGPLEMTDELRREIVGMLTRGQSADVAAANSVPAPQEKTAPVKPALQQEVGVEEQGETLPHNDPTLRTKENIALQNQLANQPASKSIVQRNHGQALPKS